MTQEIWSATVTGLGDDTGEMFSAGVYILFGEPVPPALASISITHAGASTSIPEVRPGDRLRVGDTEVVIDAVGSIANKNLGELGHTVVYLNNPKQKLLPGAMSATGPRPVPATGQHLAFIRGA
jgi:PTS system glucitol/sorbitol-specific IIA component